MSGRITVRQPFDLAQSLEMGQAFRWRRVREEKHCHGNSGEPQAPWRENGGVWYSGVLGEYLVHLRETEEGLEYRVGGEDGERHDANIDSLLQDYFRLGDDIESIYRQLRQHRGVGCAIEKHRGLRLLRQDPWECLVAYLCSGANSIRRIRSCVERIAQLSRRKVRLGCEERYIFPGPAEIARGGVRVLEKLKLGLPSRSRNILRMGECLSRHPLLLELKGTPEVSGDQAVRRLDSFRGIGPKIAGCVALMSLDKLDVFPVDRWVQRALDECDLAAMPEELKARVQSPHPLTQAQQYRVAKWAREQFGDDAGYANQYLFHWIEPHKERVGRNGVRRVCCTGPVECL